jgi:hypothetical protein
MLKPKTGKIIIPSGFYPEKHELATANVFTNMGKDVEFIAPIRTKGLSTPDVIIGGVIWEIKSPIGNGKRTLDDTIKRALKQSKNIIIDLRRSKLDDKQTVELLKKNEKLTKGVKRLIVVLKTSKTIDIKA